MNSSFFKDLNPKQIEAVKQISGPSLILAGAGSGKTKVLVHRIAFLLMEGKVQLQNILAVTFTNKAAREMKSRVFHLLKESGYPLSYTPWIGTFHSTCANILRENFALIKNRSTFTIYDQQDQLRLVKKVIRDLGLNEKNFSLKTITRQINLCKRKAIDPYKVHLIPHLDYDSNFKEIYSAYEESLIKNSAFDFGSLLLETYKLMDSNKSFLREIRDQFQFVCIDEYQDTNHIQYLIIKKISEKHQNICVVGDEDQSIYGWRGADLSNIMNFEKDFKNCKTFFLEQNYRSTKNIVDAARSVIINNKIRKGKTLFTHNAEGDKIFMKENLNEMEESYFISNYLQSLHVQKGFRYQDFAILYRTNAQSRALEDGLRKSHIPHKIVGGVRFYERTEIKDALAYLRLILNEKDDISFLRIINAPKRGIGKTSLQKIQDQAKKESANLFETAKQQLKQNFFRGKIAEELGSFIRTIKKLKNQIDTLPLYEFYILTLEETGYLEPLKMDSSAEAQNRLNNIQELGNVIDQKEKESDSRLTLSAFLEEMSLLSDEDKTKNYEESVTLMTLHNSKGLEFDCVFIAGMEEGLFPSFQSIEEDRVEEERRLCYVGMTRARKNLILSFARRRKVWGKDQFSSASRFFGEIPHSLVEYQNLSFYSPPFPHSHF